jgi:hypothetical protein
MVLRQDGTLYRCNNTKMGKLYRRKSYKIKLGVYNGKYAGTYR